MKLNSFLITVAVTLLVTGQVSAQFANLKVVTDANPDYSDMESMVHSINSRWDKDADKMWAQFYWDHIARRQTSPMHLNGFDLTDPIRQYNDYGFMMCSTISGLKCSVWNYMNYPCRYWEIGQHTVPDVWYDGRFHHYDNSLSVLYTLEDGKTVAGVPDIGRMGKGPETNDMLVAGYIAKYLCANATGPNSYLQGADVARTLKKLAEGSFRPEILEYQYFYYDQDRGHRYSLNLREGEVYTRYYSRLDADSPNAAPQRNSRSNFKADPAYFVASRSTNRDMEATNPRYRIRGNGVRVWKPVLTAEQIEGQMFAHGNITAGTNGLELINASIPGFAIFKVEGANAIASIRIRALVTGVATLSISTTNGVTWLPINKDIRDLQLIEEVNGKYEVLVRVDLQPGASLQSIDFNTITVVNSKTQPMLKIGKNTVYVGHGEQSGSIVFWPQLLNNAYQPYLFEEKNIVSVSTSPIFPQQREFSQGLIHPDDATKDGYVVFKIDAPTDVTSITYGGRFYNRRKDAHIDLLHSFDGGKTWIKSYSFTDTLPPWDKIHYVTETIIPAGVKSVLFKYLMNCQTVGGKGSPKDCSIYAIRMEVNHKLALPSNSPVEITFNWSERQEDYSLIERSHTQVVDNFPATYNINVGGYDHPVVNSLTVNLQGARGTIKQGYSDGQDAGGQKHVGTWATYGKNLAANMLYTTNRKPLEADSVWGANDDSGKRLTDTFVGSSYAGGSNYRDGAMWNEPVDITVDLGASQKCAGFRIHLFGYPERDAIKGEVKDKVEVQTSLDGLNFTSMGYFNFNLRWKDIPLNFMWTDEETFKAHVHFLPLQTPVAARYVKFKVIPDRKVGISEVMVLDGYELKPFDLMIALPNPKDNGKAPPNAGISPNARKWGPDEKLPQTIGQVWKLGGNNIDD